MAHTRPNDKPIASDQEEVIISIIDPDQELDIARKRQRLIRLRRDQESMRNMTINLTGTTHKRSRG